MQMPRAITTIFLALGLLLLPLTDRAQQTSSDKAQASSPDAKTQASSPDAKTQASSPDKAKASLPDELQASSPEAKPQAVAPAKPAVSAQAPRQPSGQAIPISCNLVHVALPGVN